MAIVRHLLTVVAGIMVTRGAMSPDSTSEFVELGIGVVAFVGTVFWSMAQKHAAKKVLNVALEEAELTEHEATALAVTAVVPVLTPPTILPVTLPKTPVV
jgi:hypothetical protein